MRYLGPERWGNTIITENVIHDVLPEDMMIVTSALAAALDGPDPDGLVR